MFLLFPFPFSSSDSTGFVTLSIGPVGTTAVSYFFFFILIIGLLSCQVGGVFKQLFEKLLFLCKILRL